MYIYALACKLQSMGSVACLGSLKAQNPDMAFGVCETHMYGPCTICVPYHCRCQCSSTA